MTIVEADLRVRAYRDDDEAAVLALLRRSLGDGPGGDRSSRFFRWKHLDNPFGRSYLIVAETGGRIVGLRAFLRWRFTAGPDRVLRAVRAVDTATDPAFQGRGIFTTLTRHAIAELRDEVDLVFNTPNEHSLPGYLKMGWLPVGEVPIAIRARRPLRITANLHRLGLDHQPRRSRPAIEAPGVATALEQVSASLPSWLARTTRDDRISTQRDPAVLAWRYAAGPLDYHAVWEPPHDHSSGGLAIFRVRPRGRLWETTIAEVLVPDGGSATVHRLLHRIARASRTDHLAGHFPSAALTRTARRSGFLPVRRGPTLVVNPLRPGLLPDPQDLDSWALSLGDVEVF